MTVRSACPTCRRTVEADPRVPLPSWFPFCCERCRLVDLGRWFAEDYRIGRAVTEGDAERQGADGARATDDVPE